MTRIKAVKILKFSLVACVTFLLQDMALQAQTVINKIETKEARPGEITTLTVLGSGFSAVKRVEAVKVGELEISVLGYTIESDEEVRVEIRIPWDAPEGRHEIAIRVSGEGFVEWLVPRPANTETVRPSISATVSDPGPPPMAGVELWLDGAPISEELHVIRFDTTSVGSSVNKSITVKNNGLATLILRDLQIPAGVQLLEAFPDSIPAGESTRLTLQFSAAAASSFSGIMQFSTNAANQSTVTLQLLATVIPAQTFPVRGRRIDFSDPGPPPMAGVELWLDGAPISEELHVIRFDTTSVGTSVNKSITVKNNGLATLILRNLQIPAGVQLLEALPDSIPAGESTRLTLQFSAAAAGSFSGIMQFNTNASNQSTVTLQLLATVIPAQTLPVRGWRIDLLIISVIALLTVGSGLIFVRRIIKKTVVKIRPVVDVGTQQIKQGKPIDSGFELRLERQLDYGKSSINSGGQLVKEQ